MLVSSVQQSDSVIHIYIHIVFQILFHHRLLQDIEENYIQYFTITNKVKESEKEYTHVCITEPLYT